MAYTFQNEWISQNNAWLSSVADDPKCAFCLVCQKSLKINHTGLRALRVHESTKKHCKRMKQFSRMRKEQSTAALSYKRRRSSVSSSSELEDHDSSNSLPPHVPLTDHSQSEMPPILQREPFVLLESVATPSDSSSEREESSSDEENQVTARTALRNSPEKNPEVADQTRKYLTLQYRESKKKALLKRIWTKDQKNGSSHPPPRQNPPSIKTADGVVGEFRIGENDDVIYPETPEPENTDDDIPCDFYSANAENSGKTDVDDEMLLTQSFSRKPEIGMTNQDRVLFQNGASNRDINEEPEMFGESTVSSVVKRTKCKEIPVLVPSTSTPLDVKRSPSSSKHMKESSAKTISSVRRPSSSVTVHATEDCAGANKPSSPSRVEKRHAKTQFPEIHSPEECNKREKNKKIKLSSSASHEGRNSSQTSSTHTGDRRKHDHKKTPRPKIKNGAIKNGSFVKFDNYVDRLRRTKRKYEAECNDILNEFHKYVYETYFARSNELGEFSFLNPLLNASNCQPDPEKDAWVAVEFILRWSGVNEEYSLPSKSSTQENGGRDGISNPAVSKTESQKCKAEASTKKRHSVPVPESREKKS